MDAVDLTEEATELFDRDSLLWVRWFSCGGDVTDDHLCCCCCCLLLLLLLTVASWPGNFLANDSFFDDANFMLCDFTSTL